MGNTSAKSLEINDNNTVTCPKCNEEVEKLILAGKSKSLRCPACEKMVAGKNAVPSEYIDVRDSKSKKSYKKSKKDDTDDDEDSNFDDDFDEEDVDDDYDDDEEDDEEEEDDAQPPIPKRKRLKPKDDFEDIPVPVTKEPRSASDILYRVITLKQYSMKNRGIRFLMNKSRRSEDGLHPLQLKQLLDEVGDWCGLRHDAIIDDLVEEYEHQLTAEAKKAQEERRTLFSRSFMTKLGIRETPSRRDRGSLRRSRFDDEYDDDEPRRDGISAEEVSQLISEKLQEQQAHFEQVREEEKREREMKELEEKRERERKEMEEKHKQELKEMEEKHEKQQEEYRKQMEEFAKKIDEIKEEKTNKYVETQLEFLKSEKEKAEKEAQKAEERHERAMEEIRKIQEENNKRQQDLQNQMWEAKISGSKERSDGVYVIDRGFEFLNKRKPIQEIVSADKNFIKDRNEAPYRQSEEKSNDNTDVEIPVDSKYSVQVSKKGTSKK